MSALKKAEQVWTRNPKAQYERFMAEEEAASPKNPSENFVFTLMLIAVVVVYVIDCLWGLPVV